jgi:succinyl-diaminopimelate desuccinylase
MRRSSASRPTPIILATPSRSAGAARSPALLTVNGRQGHAAYPHLADNPVRGLMTLLDALLVPALDDGTKDFQPTNLEITTVDVGNPSANVIAAKATTAFNIRFNDNWSAETLQTEIHNRLDRAAGKRKYRKGRKEPISYDLAWRDRPSPVFLTKDDRLIDTLTKSVGHVLGRKPGLSTTGGTSDARFIKDYCPVVEFGLVGQTMHMVDENVALADLETLTQIYQQFIEDWFG